MSNIYEDLKLQELPKDVLKLHMDSFEFLMDMFNYELAAHDDNLQATLEEIDLTIQEIQSNPNVYEALKRCLKLRGGQL